MPYDSVYPDTTKHTAGPWHTGIGNGEGCVFADGERRMRLEAGGTTLYPICNVIDFDGERDANARLIAAAPELLAACERLVDPTISHADAVGGALVLARAAIAKAEGR